MVLNEYPLVFLTGNELYISVLLLSKLAHANDHHFIYFPKL